MEKILYKGNLIAIHITRITDGSIPVTDPSYPLQLVTLKHSQGKYLAAHYHKDTTRKTTKMQECLIVRKGLVKVDLYAPTGVKFIDITLKTGDVLILVNGGYGIHVISDCELIEVKNGPFIEDKVLYSP